MMPLRSLMALAMLAVTVSAGPADARSTGWELLGKRSVHLYGDHDVIPVTAARGAIDLRGQDRFIRRVDLSYRRLPNNRGRAIVELWGRH
jgi:hypothetical protein